MSLIRWAVGLVVLAGVGTWSVDTAQAQRGGMAHGGFNALSTTVYGTQVPQVQTNVGPVGRPMGTYGGTNLFTNAGPVGRSSVIGPPHLPPGIVRPGTNSISETNALFGNTPYAGTQAALSSLGLGLPNWNGTGNASGRLRATSFVSAFPGPLLIPESLGNPYEPPILNGPNGTGTTSKGAGKRVDYRFLSAYGNLPGYKQEIIPEGNPGTSSRALTRLGQPFKWPKFDYRSISAYADLERGGQQSAQPENSRPENQTRPAVPKSQGEKPPLTPGPSPSRGEGSK